MATIVRINVPQDKFQIMAGQVQRAIRQGPARLNFRTVKGQPGVYHVFSNDTGTLVSIPDRLKQILENFEGVTIEEV